MYTCLREKSNPVCDSLYCTYTQRHAHIPENSTNLGSVTTKIKVNFGSNPRVSSLVSSFTSFHPTHPQHSPKGTRFHPRWNQPALDSAQAQKQPELHWPLTEVTGSAHQNSQYSSEWRPKYFVRLYSWEKDSAQHFSPMGLFSLVNSRWASLLRWDA